MEGYYQTGVKERDLEQVEIEACMMTFVSVNYLNTQCDKRGGSEVSCTNET